MAFETRQENGQDVQYYVAPSQELPTKLNSKPVEETEELIPFDGSNEAPPSDFGFGEFTGIDFNYGVDFESTLSDDSNLGDLYKPLPPHFEILAANNISTQADLTKYLDSLTYEDRLSTQQKLKPLLVEGKEGVLNNNIINDFIQNQAYKGGDISKNLQGIPARMTQSFGNYLVDTVPSNLRMLAGTSAYGGNYSADTLTWQQKTDKPWAIDFLGVGKEIFGKEIPYLNAPLPKGSSRDSLDNVPFWKQVLQSSATIDSALLPLIGQDSSNTPGANINGQFLDQLQLEELGVKNYELVAAGNDQLNRMTTGSYAKLIPWNIALNKNEVTKEELLALGIPEEKIFDRYDGEHFVIGPIRPGDLMDQKGVSVSPELILERDSTGKLIDVRYGGRSYTAGLSGTQSLLGIETKRSDWAGYNFYEPDQIYLGKERTIQAFTEQAALPLVANIALIMATKKPLKTVGISPHLPGTAKFARMIKTGQDVRNWRNLTSPTFWKSIPPSLVGRAGLATNEWGMSSLLVGHFINNPQGEQGGTMSPELASMMFGDNNLITKMLSTLSVKSTDSTAVGNVKVALDDLIIGAGVGIPIDFTGSGLRSIKNAPSFWSPRIQNAIKQLQLTKNIDGKSIYRQNDFNWDDFSSGKYTSIFEKFDKGLTEQLSLSTDDLRAIATIKKDIQPLVSKISSTIIDGARVEALYFRLKKLNELRTKTIPAGYDGAKKNYVRPESGATQSEAGSPWQKYTEERRPETLWETPYSEQKQLELTENKSELEEEVKTVEAEIVEAESRLGESATELEEAVVRSQESVTPTEKQSLINQGVDSNLAPPIQTEIQKIAVSDIDTAPDYFQVKSSGRGKKGGVSGSLAEVKQFEPVLAGVVSVWRDTQGQIGPAGKVYIIDGHNRLDLAKRSGVDEIDVRFIDVDTPAEARAIAAMQNIAGTQSYKGSIEALDVAEYLREDGFTIDDLAARGLNLQSRVVAEAVQLNRLPDSLFKKVQAGELSVQKALAYGSVEGVKPEAILDLYKIASKGKWSIERINQGMQMAKNATVGIEEGVIPGLSSYFKSSDIKQLLSVRVEVVKQLKQRVTALRTASSDTQASILEGVEGTRINVKGSQIERLQARAVLNIFNQVAGLEGEVTGLLKEIASEVKGRNVKTLVEERLPEIINALKVESQGKKPPETELTQSVKKQAQTQTIRKTQTFKTTPSKTIEAEKSQGILDKAPTTDKTVDKVPEEIRTQLSKVKQEQDNIDPWDDIDAKDQTLEIEGERIDQPLRESLTTKEGSDLLPEDVGGEELESASTALTKIDPKTPLDILIRSAPKEQQAGIAFTRLIDAFEKFSEGMEDNRGLGPINTVGDLLNLLNIGRVAIEEGTQKALRDAETTELFRRQIAPYLTKASKLAIQRAIEDIDKVQIYVKGLQYEISQKLKGVEQKILDEGKKADKELKNIENWEAPKFLSDTLKRMGLEEDSKRVFFEQSPTFNDSSQNRFAFGNPKPTYANGRTKMNIEWESDVDLAIYIVTSGKVSKKRSVYLEWLTEELGIPDDFIATAGAAIREELSENLESGITYRLADQGNWRAGANLDYMVFRYEDELIGKYKSEQDKELLRKLNELNDPKDPGDQLAPKPEDEVDFQVEGETPKLPKLPRHIAQFGDSTVQSIFRGPLTELEVQATLERIVTRMAPYVKVEQPVAYMAKGTDVGKKHPGVKRTEESEFVKGFYKRAGMSPTQDLVMIARYIGSNPRSIGDRVWTAFHEGWHAVMRRHMTKAEFRLLLEGKKELEQIAAMVMPSKADVILSGKYPFSEVTAMASSGWDVYKKHVLKPSAPDPTWAQPILKMRKIAKAVRRYIFGLMDGGKPAYETWDQVFEAGRSGELGARGVVEPQKFWMDSENEMYRFGGKKPGVVERDGIEYEPTTPTPDPEGIPDLLKRVKTRIADGQVSFREAIVSDNYQTVRRMISRGKNPQGNYDATIPGKKLYIGMGGEDIALANKVLEDTITAHFGDRSGFSGIDRINLEEIARYAREQLRGTDFDVETTIRLYEEARGGSIQSQQDLITQTALLIHRDQNLYVLKELALELQQLNDGISTSDKLTLSNRLVSVFQNQLMLDQAWVSASRKWGQQGRAMQKDWELVEQALPIGTTLTKQLNVNDVEKGLTTEDGLLGEGVYFTASDSAEGFKGRIPNDVLIVDLPSAGKSLANFLGDINLDAPSSRYSLTANQKDGIKTWLTENNYGGIRFEGKNGEDVVLVYDTNDANRIIDSDAATYPTRDTNQPTIKTLFEEAAIRSGQLLEKKLTPELALQLKTGKYSAELEAIIDEMARAVFNLGNGTELEAKYYFEDLSDLINRTPNGKLTQRAITNFIRNAQFLRASTWAKVLGGGMFRALTLPTQQYVGAWHTKRKAIADDNEFDAWSADYRMKLNKKLFTLYAQQLPNMLRMAKQSFKHDEVFVNLSRGFFEDARVKEYEETIQSGIDVDSFRAFESQKRALRKKPTGDEWWLKPTSNWQALAWKYIAEGLRSGARRGMGAMDTFLNAMVGPSLEKIRLMEFEAEKLRQTGVPLTPLKELEIEKRVNEQLKKLWIDVEINGEVVKGGYFDSSYAKNAMDYVNFTDDIDVDLARRTYQYGVRKAKDLGLTNNAEIVRYAEDYANGKLSNPTAENEFQKGPKLLRQGVEATFAVARKGINTPSAMLKAGESRLPLLGSLIITNRTPLNIAKATIRYTGMGQHIIDSAWRDINHEDFFIRERALGEWSTGVLMLTTGMGLAATGLVQFSGPEPLSMAERKENQNLKIQSNSIRFRAPWSDWSPWYDIQMFDAASTVFGIIGSYQQGLKKIPHEEYMDLTNPGPQALAHAGLHISALKFAISRGLQGELTKDTMQHFINLSDLIQSFGPENKIDNPIGGRSGLGAGQAQLEKLIAKAVPGLVTSAARNLDPTVRTIDQANTGNVVLDTLVNTMNRIATKVPYLSYTQPPQLHPTTGDPITYDGTLGTKTIEGIMPFGDVTKLLYGAFSPTGAVKQLTQSTDPVDLEFAKLFGKGGNFTIWSKRMIDIPNRKMTQTEFNRLITIGTKEVEIGGMKMHEYLTWVITKDPKYLALPQPGEELPSQNNEHTRVKYLKKVIDWFINGAPGETRTNPKNGFIINSAKELWMREHPEVEALINGITETDKVRDFEISMGEFDSSTYGPQASLEQWRLLTADPTT